MSVSTVTKVSKCSEVWSDSVKWSYWHCMFFDVYCLLLCLRLVRKHLLSLNSFPYFCRQEKRKSYRLYEARREKVNKNYCIGLPLKSQKQKPGTNFLNSVRQIHLWLMWKSRVILILITVVRNKPKVSSRCLERLCM